MANSKKRISDIHAQNYSVYGARKVWLALNRENVEVARCTVERLMAELGLVGAVRGKPQPTTITDSAAARPIDLVSRQFGSAAPNRLWVADLTYVSTWSGFAYVAFVTDAYARRILGSRVAATMATSMVLDCIEHAIWTRQQEGTFDLKVLSTIPIGDHNTPRYGSPSDSLTPVSNRLWAPWEALMTTRWPRRSTVSTKPN